MVTSGVRDLWARLAADGVETSGFVRLRFAGVRSCPAYAARGIESGLEALMLEVEKETLPHGGAFPQTRGFSVTAEALDPGRTGRTRLLLSLVEERYRDVFIALAEDVLHHLELSASAGEAVREMLARLGRWQTFLKQHDPEGLSVTERRGLYGELLIFRRLLDLGLEPSRAIDGWRGPGASSHDFQLPAGSIEVKTTAAVTPSGFKVNNVKQLDDTSVPTLIVAVAIVDESESAGSSLPDLVADIEERLPDVCFPTWEDALTSVGYLRVQGDRYEQPKYVERDLRLYRVREGFPRLLESDLPDGVSEVSYTVALGAIMRFRCDESELVAMVEKDR